MKGVGIKVNKRTIIVIVISVLIIGNLLQFAHNYSRLSRNAVPNEETAIAITQAAFSEFLEPKYIRSAGNVYWGLEASFDRFRGVWIVSAYLQQPEGVFIMYRGPEVTIRMRDGRIMDFRFP